MRLATDVLAEELEQVGRQVSDWTFGFPSLLPGLRQEASLGQTQLLHQLRQFSGCYDDGTIFSNPTV